MSAGDDTAAVRAQWAGTGDLAAAVRAALGGAGLGAGTLAPEDLASLDQFHPGGLAATLALLELAGAARGETVLDIGGGLGGPARTIARRCGAAVTVLDLTPAYCAIGRWLTAWSAPGDRVRFVAGDAVALPFRDAAFDVAWMQAGGMNIAAKERLYDEIRRVLRPGGRLVFEELLTGRRVPLRFPVPWADEQELSYLRPPEAVRALLAARGFRERAWADVSAATLAAMRATVPAAPGAPGVQLLLGANAASKLANLGRNLAEGRLAVIRGLFARP